MVIKAEENYTIAQIKIEDSGFQDFLLISIKCRERMIYDEF